MRDFGGDSAGDRPSSPREEVTRSTTESRNSDGVAANLGVLGGLGALGGLPAMTTWTLANPTEAVAIGVTGAEVLLGLPGQTTSYPTSNLAIRAQEIHSILDPIAQSRRTTAILRTNAGDLVAGGARDLSRAQRALLGPGEIGATLPGAHAEVTALDAAAKLGLEPQALAVIRAICPACAVPIERAGGIVTSPTTAEFPGH